jgi:outer membrane protein
MSHANVSSKRAEPRRPRRAPLVALSAGLAVGASLTGCVPYDAPVSHRLQRLIDSTDEAPRSLPLGSRDPTSIDDATAAFIEREGGTASRGDAIDATRLTIDDLRLSVIENNLDLRVASFGPRVAEESLNAERAKFDAVFVADVSYADQDLPVGNSQIFSLSSNDPALSGASGIFTESEIDREVFKGGAGVGVPLPTGAKVGIKQSVEIDDKSGSGLLSTEDRAGSTFSISQPLLRGGGIAVNTASIRLARLGFGVEAAENKLTLIRVLANTEKAYWRLYAAEKQLEVQREQFELARNNFELVDQLITEGLTPPVERFAAELAVAEQRQGLVIAETAVRLRARDLARALNRPDLPLGNPEGVRVASDPALVRYEIDADALVERALTERLELLELELKLAADAIKIDLAENAKLPVFVVDFQYGLGERSSTIGSSLAGSFEFDNPQWAIGARAEIPITNDAAEARYRRSLISRLQRTATREQKRLAIRQEVYDAADVLAQNWDALLARRIEVIAAGANYEAQQRLFREGLRNAQDVLVALNKLGMARQKEVKAIASYQVAQIDLAYATGTLLGYAGTEITPDTPTTEQ